MNEQAAIVQDAAPDPEVLQAAEGAATLAAELAAPTLSRSYRCQCGRPVFLRNSQCLACQTPLGYVEARLGVVPLAPAQGEGVPPDTFTVFGDPQGPLYAAAPTS